MGRCPDCSDWNTLVEDVDVGKHHSNRYLGGYAKESQQTVSFLENIPFEKEVRVTTGFGELDRVLGGGLVEGSVVLIGGDPGIGKSTLLLEALCRISEKNAALYVTGEESLQQVSMRAKRLSLSAARLQVLAETHVERVIQQAIQHDPKVLVIDSIQTLFSNEISSAPGSVSQVRECAAKLVAFAKQYHVALFLVGHVTKEGAIAGPRVLEHMVDCVLYFEGDRSSRFRVIRAIKNRFGAVNELGVFAMTDKGLREINNPSALFLSHMQHSTPGSIVMATWEGSRPLLVEMQALVDTSYLGNPRRVCVGLEQNRLSMLLAVLNKHAHVATHDQDVFVNVVGGMRVTETGGDVPLLLSVLSSLKNKVLPRDLMAFGEVGLAGEIRPVQGGQERIHEALKHGFKTAIVPKANAPKKVMKGIDVIGVEHFDGVMSAVFQ